MRVLWRNRSELCAGFLQEQNAKTIPTSRTPQAFASQVRFQTWTRFLPPLVFHLRIHTGRGKNVTPKAGAYRQDMWSYSPPVEKSEPLHRHIDALWLKLKPHKLYLLGLKKSLNVDVFVGYRSNCDNAGIEVPHTSLEIFTELEIPFGVSIIVT